MRICWRCSMPGSSISPSWTIGRRACGRASTRRSGFTRRSCYVNRRRPVGRSVSRAPGLAALLAGFHQDVKKRHLVALKFAEYQQRIARLGPVHAISQWQKVKPIHDLFRRYAQDYRSDHLMLLAQGYQESRLNQRAGSHPAAPSGSCN